MPHDTRFVLMGTGMLGLGMRRKEKEIDFQKKPGLLNGEPARSALNRVDLRLDGETYRVHTTGCGQGGITATSV